jgi:hypothetical protein
MQSSEASRHKTPDGLPAGSMQRAKDETKTKTLLAIMLRYFDQVIITLKEYFLL